MNLRKFTVGILAAFVLTMCAVGAQAQPYNRTFVRSNGADTVTCGQVTEPCLTFNTAISHTNATGTIIALDAFGFGQVTINKAITIEALPGIYAFVKPQPSSTGILVAGAPTDIIVLRNLIIDGQGGASTIGVAHTGGKLTVQNCKFMQLTTGLSVTNAKMDLINSDFTGNGVGVNADGTGTDGQQMNPSTTQVRVAFGNIVGNTVGLRMTNPGTGFFNIWFFTVGTGGTPNVIGNTTNEQQCTPGCTAIQNIQTYGSNTILP